MILNIRVFTSLYVRAHVFKITFKFHLFNSNSYLTLLHLKNTYENLNTLALCRKYRYTSALLVEK